MADALDHPDQGATTAPNWVNNAAVLWEKRRTLTLTAAIALMLSLAIALILPKRYESSARIMPPANTGSGAALLAAFAGSGGGALGSLGSLGGLGRLREPAGQHTGECRRGKR